jgi:hypothetical protein
MQKENNYFNFEQLTYFSRLYLVFKNSSFLILILSLFLIPFLWFISWVDDFEMPWGFLWPFLLFMFLNTLLVSPILNKKQRFIISLCFCLLILVITFIFTLKLGFTFSALIGIYSSHLFIRLIIKERIF